MPGPAVHYIIGELLRKNVSKQDSTYINKEFYFDQKTAKILNENQNYLNAGTLGPDFLFFNVKDWPYVGDFAPMKQIIQGATLLKQLENELERSFPIFEDIHNAKETITSEINEFGEDIINSSATLKKINFLLDDVKSIINIMGKTVNVGIKDLLSSNIDIFGMLKHPIQNCEGNEKWWWFDVLHYRRTGKFAEYLYKNSHTDQLKAYSMGYLSHLTADTVGHPYINTLVRGPYRNHAQRHKVIENFQDVSAFKNYGYGEFISSELYKKFSFSELTNTTFFGSVDREVTSIIDGITPGFADRGMPKDLANLISKASKEVYMKDGKHLFGGGMEPEEVDAAYRLWLSWFTATTSEAILPTSLPGLPSLSEDLRQIWEAFQKKIKEAMSELADAINDLFSGKVGSSFSFKNIVNFFKKVGRVLSAAVAAAKALVEALEELILLIPTHAVHFVLNQIYQAMYVVYDYFRMSISLNGIAFPTIQHTKDYKVQHMLHPANNDSAGNHLLTNWPYPTLAIDTGSWIFRTVKQEAHLVYPPPKLEQQHSVSGPNSYYHNGHGYFIDQPIKFNRSLLPSLENPIMAVKNNQLYTTENFGNALVLTSKYFDLLNEGKPLPNLNLDADRGMGFPTWNSGICDGDKNLIKPVSVSIID